LNLMMIDFKTCMLSAQLSSSSNDSCGLYNFRF
jgi:hypothetical protein